MSVPQTISTKPTNWAVNPVHGIPIFAKQPVRGSELQEKHLL